MEDWLNTVRSEHVATDTCWYNVAIPNSNDDILLVLTNSDVALDGALHSAQRSTKCRPYRLSQSQPIRIAQCRPEFPPQPEHYRGNVNPIGVRACYDEGKRAAETLFFDYQIIHIAVLFALDLLLLSISSLTYCSYLVTVSLVQVSQQVSR